MSMNLNTYTEKWIAERHSFFSETSGKWVRSGHSIEDENGQNVCDWVFLGDAQFIVDASHNFHIAVDVIENIFNMHKPIMTANNSVTVCSECQKISRNNVTYPCSTVQLLEKYFMPISSTN